MATADSQAEDQDMYVHAVVMTILQTAERLNQIEPQSIQHAHQVLPVVIAAGSRGIHSEEKNAIFHEMLLRTFQASSLHNSLLYALDEAKHEILYAVTGESYETNGVLIAKQLHDLNGRLVLIEDPTERGDAAFTLSLPLFRHYINEGAMWAGGVEEVHEYLTTCLALSFGLLHSDVARSVAESDARIRWLRMNSGSTIFSTCVILFQAREFNT